MKILVIDDEHSFGKLLGHALKRLGHKPVIAVHPDDALAMLSGDVDAVITDIDMPGMNGVELARVIRERMPQMPVAFCTGSAPEGETVQTAQKIGRVLPKVWTVADVKQVVAELAQARESHRPRTHRRHSSVAHLYDRGERAAPSAARPKPRRTRVSFANWKQVRALTDDARRGPVYLRVRGPADVEPGTEMSISLALPDEITVRIAGQVDEVQACGENEAEVVIQLTGLVGDAAARLRALADTSEPEQPAQTSHLHGSPHAERQPRTARGSEPPLARGSARDLRVSEVLRNNQRLREQIEDLATKMTPRPETDD